MFKRFNQKYSHAEADEFCIWKGIIQRCSVGSSDNALYYGRGIRMSKKWRKSFRTFFEDMGHRPSSRHSIERIDNNGPYSKENCRWATATEQARNRRSNVFLTYNGETKTQKEWSEKLGMNYGTFQSRIKRGWDLKRAFTEPATGRLITFRGITKTVKDWCKETGVSIGTFLARIDRYGWSIERAFTVPLRPDKRRI